MLILNLATLSRNIYIAVQFGGSTGNSSISIQSFDLILMSVVYQSNLLKQPVPGRGNSPAGILPGEELERSK